MSKEQTQAEKAKAALDASKTTPAPAMPAPKPAPAPTPAPEPTPEPAKKRTGFISPLEIGVSYGEFLASVPEKKSIAAYLKGKKGFEKKDTIDWIVSEIDHYKKSKK